jgi:hypothetical protein
MTMTTYNPRRLSPGAQKLRSYLYKVWFLAILSGWVTV